jgi:hypothetical protein
VWYYSDNLTALIILVEECKSTWVRLRSYYRKELRRRESTSGQAARKVKKWRFEEQMRFLQNNFQEMGWVVTKMIHACKLKKSNSSERIVPEYDKEGKSTYFIRRPTCISVLMSTTNCYIFIRVGTQHIVSVFRVYLNKNTKTMQALETSVTTH